MVEAHEALWTPPERNKRGRAGDHRRGRRWRRRSKRAQAELTGESGGPVRGHGEGRRRGIGWGREEETEKRMVDWDLERRFGRPTIIALITGERKLAGYKLIRVLILCEDSASYIETGKLLTNTSTTRVVSLLILFTRAQSLELMEYIYAHD